LNRTVFESGRHWPVRLMGIISTINTKPDPPNDY
jgi:hypothetical protein